MADTVSPAKRSDVMRRVRSKNTKPELTVRRALHRLGFRFRLYQAKLPGKPDLVLKRHRVVVFVHGCLWHWHGCKNSRMPHSNVDYWESKIARNRERDELHRSKLESSGWRVQIIWECTIDQGLDDLVRLLRETRQP